MTIKSALPFHLFRPLILSLAVFSAAACDSTPRLIGGSGAQANGDGDGDVTGDGDDSISLGGDAPTGDLPLGFAAPRTLAPTTCAATLAITALFR